MIIPHRLQSRDKGHLSRCRARQAVALLHLPLQQLTHGLRIDELKVHPCSCGTKQAKEVHPLHADLHGLFLQMQQCRQHPVIMHAHMNMHLINLLQISFAIQTIGSSSQEGIRTAQAVPNIITR